MACSQLEEPGATYLVRQCLKIADENTLWLLTSQPGDHDRRIVYDRARHAMPLPADGGASVNLFTQGAVAGHAGPPQAGPAGAGPSLTLLQGQLIFAKESRVTVLLLTGVVLLRDGQAHVYPPVPISETILSVTLDPFSLVLFIYCVLALSQGSTPTQATLDGFAAPLTTRMDARATRKVCKSCDGLVSGVTDPAHPRGYQCYKGWKDDRGVIAIRSRQVSQPCYQMAVQSQPGQGALFSAPRHFSCDA